MSRVKRTLITKKSKDVPKQSLIKQVASQSDAKNKEPKDVKPKDPTPKPEKVKEPVKGEVEIIDKPVDDNDKPVEAVEPSEPELDYDTMTADELEALANEELEKDVASANDVEQEEPAKIQNVYMSDYFKRLKDVKDQSWHTVQTFEDFRTAAKEFKEKLGHAFVIRVKDYLQNDLVYRFIDYLVNQGNCRIELVEILSRISTKSYTVKGKKISKSTLIYEIAGIVEDTK
jgi:hypothetical protein